MALSQTKYAWSTFFLFLFSSCHAPKIESQILYAYALTNQQFVGDKNQILGVCNALANHTQSQNIISKTFDTTSMDELEKDVQQSLNTPAASTWIITSGDYGIAAISQLKKYTRLKFCHIAHQQTTQHFALLDVANIIALPTHATSQELLSAAKASTTALVQTIGVAHNLSETTITQDYAQNKATIHLNPPYVGVILAGDAPEPDGTMRYYTKQEAQMLADYLAKQVGKERCRLLILNGPRTGKHDPFIQEIRPQAHKDGQPDAVTKQFVKTLQANGLQTDKDFQLFDFQFGQPSMYTTVLGAIKETGGHMFVPGESTSMVCECTSHLSPTHVTIYHNQAMNKHHQAHVLSEHQAGRASMLDGNFQLQEPQNCPAGSGAAVSAAATIANKIIASNMP